MTWTGLHDACERQDTEAVLQLIAKNGDDAFNVDDHGETPLHIACWSAPPLKIVQALIAAFPQAVTDQDVHGDTPLHVALRNPKTSPEVVRELLKACPTVVSMGNNEGLYPLHMACRHGQEEAIITILLEEDPYALRTPIKIGELAPRKLKSDLSSKKDSDHVILDATHIDRLADTDTLVNLGFVDAEKQLRDGAYPLHMAIASNASKAVVEMLLREAPDVCKMTNKYGETPLHVALATEADTEIIELLLHMKEDLDALKVADDRKGNLPLHLAAIHGGRIGVAVLLLTEYQDAVYQKNRDGKTPIDLAKEYRHCSDDFLHLLESSAFPSKVAH